MNNRLIRLRQKLNEENIDAILISQRDNRYYMSGFTGSDGYLLISTSKAILATDFRYYEQVVGTLHDYVVIQIEGDLSRWLPTLIADLSIERLGFESDDLTVSAYQKLIEASQSIANISMVPTIDFVAGLRAVKDISELDLICKACSLADDAFNNVISNIRQGTTEKKVALDIEMFLRENGSEGIPFKIIVASGPNAAFPHAQPTDRIILNGEPIVIDYGARVGGYCSDMTRTIYLGKRDKTFSNIYTIVLDAQLAAINGIKSGMTGTQADQISRAIIEQYGYGKYFGHGLGHSLGLAVHENPRLSPESDACFTDGMVFTIEPGVYIPGWGGVRIEDTVMLDDGKITVLCTASKI